MVTPGLSVSLTLVVIITFEIFMLSITVAVAAQLSLVRILTKIQLSPLPSSVAPNVKVACVPSARRISVNVRFLANVYVGAEPPPILLVAVIVACSATVVMLVLFVATVSSGTTGLAMHHNTRRC
jgi:hypothetical protein